MKKRLSKSGVLKQNTVVTKKDTVYIGNPNNWRTQRLNIGYKNRIYGPIGSIGDYFTLKEIYEGNKIHLNGKFGVDLEKDQNFPSPSLLISRHVESVNNGKIIFLVRENSKSLDHERGSLTENRKLKIPIRIIQESVDNGDVFNYLGLYWVTTIFRKSNKSFFIFKLIRMEGQKEINERKRKRNDVEDVLPELKRKKNDDHPDYFDALFANTRELEKHKILGKKKKYKENIEKQNEMIEKFRRKFKDEELVKLAEISRDFQEQSFKRIEGIKNNLDNNTSLVTTIEELPFKIHLF